MTLDTDEFYALWDEHKIAEKVAELKASAITTSPTTRCLLMVGMTGAGISTTVNYLLGKRMEAKVNDHTGVACVDSPEAVCAIGHNDAVSHTLVPQLVVDNSMRIGFIDTAGVNESRGPPIEMIAAASLNKAVPHFPPDIHGVCFVVTWDRIWVDRCSILTTIDDTLRQLFGGAEYLEAEKGFNPRVFYLITKAPADVEVEHVTRRLHEAYRQVKHVINEMKGGGRGGGSGVARMMRRQHIMLDVAKHAMIVRPLGIRADTDRLALLDRMLPLSQFTDPRVLVASKMLNAPLSDAVLFMASQLMPDCFSKVRDSFDGYESAKREFDGLQTVLARKSGELQRVCENLQSLKERRDLGEAVQVDLDDVQQAVRDAEVRVSDAKSKIDRYEREEESLMQRRTAHRQSKDTLRESGSYHGSRRDEIWRQTVYALKSCVFTSYRVDMNNARWVSSPTVEYSGTTEPSKFSAEWEVASTTMLGSVTVKFFIVSGEHPEYKVEEEEIERVIRNNTRKTEEAVSELSEAVSELSEAREDRIKWRQTVREHKRDIRGVKAASDDVIVEYERAVAKLEGEVKEAGLLPAQQLHAIVGAVQATDAALAQTARALAVFATHKCFAGDAREFEAAHRLFKAAVEWVMGMVNGVGNGEDMRLYGVDGVDWSKFKVDDEKTAQMVAMM